MSRSRALLGSVLFGFAGAALGAVVTYWLVRGGLAGRNPTPALARPSPFLAALAPPALIEKGSAGRARWEWAEVTGPAAARCGTCMRNFVGHAKLGPKDGEEPFIVNDLQHQVWAAIEAAGGRVLHSNNGRYHNGQTKTDFRDGRPNLVREYQYCCYRIGDDFGVAHMVGFREGEDLTVVLIVHEQSQGPPFPPDMPAEEKNEDWRPKPGDERPGTVRSERVEEGWPADPGEEKQPGQKR
jgi:hypothetical protein